MQQSEDEVEVVRYNDAAEFSKAVYPYLIRQEITNGFILGVVEALVLRPGTHLHRITNVPSSKTK